MATYHCDNPTLHSVLKLNCPCYKKHRIMSPTTGEVPQHKDDDGILNHSRFESTKDPYQKEMMKMRALRPHELKKAQERSEQINFIPDWNGWNRHIWSTANFSGQKVGPFNLKVSYSKNIAGYQIGDTFAKRSPKIVTHNQGLCVNLPHNLKAGMTSLNNGAYILFEFDGNPTSIQFALLSMTIDSGRKDAARIFCNGKPIVEGEFYHGDGVKFTGNTFLATKRTPDTVGMSDVLVKVVKPEKIKTLKIEFSNLDSDPHGGRLALTDILLK